MVLVRAKVSGVSRRSLERFLASAQRAAGVAGEVNVLVTGSAEMRRLNRSFRGKDWATDVLSFPAPVNGVGGEVAICAPVAARNARRLGHSTGKELQVLILHGILHLAGYDHERDGGEMARKETRLRRALGLPVGLIERVLKRSRTHTWLPAQSRPKKL
ncbi:MAG: rRNA maturation RNase YbeY [Acidobacteria bacterium]|nr:rRNA maturation RNase YbeY [Acidobacteriota bacterium]